MLKSRNLKKIVIACIGSVTFIGVSNASIIVGKNPVHRDWICSAVDGNWQCEKSSLEPTLFTPNLSKKEKQKTLANALMWIPDRKLHTKGYYYNGSTATKPYCETDDSNLSYKNAEIAQDGLIIANGNVAFLQCGQELFSDTAIISLDKNNTGIGAINLIGNVTTKQSDKGIIMKSRDMASNLTDNTSLSTDTYFRFKVNMPDYTIYNKNHFTGALRGYAKTLNQTNKNNYRMQDSFITSASPYSNTWKITSDAMDINTNEDMFYMKGNVLRVKNIPILYFPYFSHPTNGKRKSGFLIPYYVSNDVAGYGIVIPYYFNLAPNYDLLLNNILWNKRGIMQSGEFRYMTNTHNGEFMGSFIGYDSKTKKARGDFTFYDNGTYDNGIQTLFRYDYVSDEDYYNTFSAGNIDLITKTLLNRQVAISYTNDYIDSKLEFLKYGLVNSDLVVNNIPYAKLPDLKFNFDAADSIPSDIGFTLNTQNTYFYKKAAIESTESPEEKTNVNAFRSYESPKFMYNLERTYGYFKPSLEVPIRYYKLDNKESDIIKFKKNNVLSVIPIFNIDTALYFDKSFSNEIGNFTESLEPRLFYTYIPYQNQQDIPLFDTSLQNQQYKQMFEVNRFSGMDRINNANQIAYALETKTLNDDTGDTVFEAKIGQQMFFADRRVSLAQGYNTDYENPDQMDPFYNERFSPIMETMKYQFSKNLSFSADVTYRISNKNWDYQVYSLEYQTDNHNLFNISYNNIANNYANMTQDQINDGEQPEQQKSVALSGLINLTNSWSIAGLINYNIIEHRTSDMFAGFQYDQPSWATRMIYQRIVSNFDVNNPSELVGDLNSSFMLQVELKGIGAFSNRNLRARLMQIANYDNAWG